MALTNAQYDQITRYYEHLREDNRYEAQRRHEQAYRVLPELFDLDELKATLAMEKLRSRFDSSLKEPGLSFEQITDRRHALLLSAGYPVEYLDPIYTCADCKDTGYITADLEHLGDAGSVKKKCHCFIKKEIEFLYENSNMEASLLDCTFDKVKYDLREGEDLANLRRTVEKCYSFVEHFDTYQNLLFMGTVGTGKSFLSGCIANALIQKGCSVVYFSAISLFETLGRYFFGTKAKETLYNFCKDLYNYDCVIIDDLGTEVTNSFVSSQLFDLINERNMGKKATIISTNLGLDELRDRYSDRTLSRISTTFTLCELTGPDYRIMRAGQR